MGDQPPGGGGGEGKWMGRHVIGVSVADDGARARPTRIQPEVLLRQVHPAIPEDGVRDHAGALLGRGSAGLEELIAQGTVGAEALARWAGEYAGTATGWAGLLSLGIRRRGWKVEDGLPSHPLLNRLLRGDNRNLRRIAGRGVGG